MSKLIITVVALIVAGILFLGMIQFATGQSPIEFFKDLIKPSSGPSSSEVSSLEYEYSLSLSGSYDSNNEYSVRFDIINETAESVCYTYKITDVSEGDPYVAKGFMEGFYSAKEGEPFCSPKNINAEGFMPIYPLVSPGTTFHGTKSGSDYSYTYDYENGILRSFSMTSDAGNISFSLKKINSQGQSTTATTPAITTTQSGFGGAVLTSTNVSWMRYRFTVVIPMLDILTGEVTQVKHLNYTVRVDVVNRQGMQACVKYTIEDVANGTYEDIVQYMSDMFGYRPNDMRCVDLSQDPTPEGIPYFLFNPQFTAADVPLEGDGLSGKFSVENGIFKSLTLFIQNRMIDENGTVIASSTTTFTAYMLDKG